MDAEEFITIWQKADSPEEVMEKTGLSYNRVTAKAVYYRRRGIPLKKFRSGPKGLDIDYLADLARRLEDSE